MNKKNTGAYKKDAGIKDNHKKYIIDFLEFL